MRNGCALIGSGLACLVGLAILGAAVANFGPILAFAVLSIGLAFTRSGRRGRRSRPASDEFALRRPSLPNGARRPVQAHSAAGLTVQHAPQGGHRGRQLAPVHARSVIPAGLRFHVLARDGFRCRYCGRSGTDPDVILHVDHVVPVIMGGPTDEANLVTACSSCNLGKGQSALTPAIHHGLGAP